MTPRLKRHKPTNRSRALQACIAIRTAWESTDAALTALVNAGTIKGGALLVHASAFNYHLNKLMDGSEPTNFDVTYHTAEAKKALQAAKDFVAERKDLTPSVEVVK